MEEAVSAAPRVSDRARALVADSLVVNGAEILRGGGPGRPRLLIDPFEVDDATIEGWRRAGLHVVMPPIACMEVDMHAGVMRSVAAWNAVIAGRPGDLLRVDCAADLDRARAGDRIGVILGVHHGEQFRTVDDVDLFHRFGLRWALIASHAQNLIGASMNERNDPGLSNFGLRVVERMNRVGMAIDVSHCGDRTTLDAIECSDGPVLLSHANCRAVCDNPRNKTDEAIRRLAAKGGVIGLMVIRMTVRDREPTTLEHYLDHMDHVRSIVGADCIGLGFESPVEGYDSIPAEHQIPLPAYMRNPGVQRKLDIEALAQPLRVHAIADGLLQRGWSEAEVRGVLGTNFRRCLDRIWGDGRPQPQAAATRLVSR